MPKQRPKFRAGQLRRRITIWTEGTMSQDSTGAIVAGDPQALWSGRAAIIPGASSEYWKDEQVRAIASDLVTVRGDSVTRTLDTTMWITYAPNPALPDVTLRMDIVQINNIEERGFQIDILVKRGGS